MQGGLKMLCVDVAVIGGGPAGLAAALAAKNEGAEKVLIIERDGRLGGILNQCIHNGFGLHRFKAELTGPEYAQRYIDLVAAEDIELMLDTIVLSVSPERIIKCSSTEGLSFVSAKAVVFAMGCRERSRGAVNVPGFRPAGVYSAGTAQRLMNIEGFMPGKKAVVVGSGDIGLIMARRLSLEGAKVLAVVELMPYSGGLRRNIAQCLDDFGIELMLSHTVTKIHGQKRVEGISIAEVDKEFKAVAGTERYIECDTLLYSVGLIPENELSLGLGLEIDTRTSGPYVNDRLMTKAPGVFACGNVLHVHDLADNVSVEAEKAGRFAAEYAKAFSSAQAEGSDIAAGRDSADADWAPAELELPVKEKNYASASGLREISCIRCPKGCVLRLEYPDKVEDFSCPMGQEYGINEMHHPMRSVCSAVRLTGAAVAMLPVRTSREVPKEKIAAVMRAIHSCEVKAPVKSGDVIIRDAAQTGADIIATRDIKGA